MNTSSVNEPQRERLRRGAYWISAAVSTLLFLLFVTTMLMVPGIASTSKVWMLTVVDVCVIFSLALGIWRFDSTDVRPALAIRHNACCNVGA